MIQKNGSAIAPVVCLSALCLPAAIHFLDVICHLSQRIPAVGKNFCLNDANICIFHGSNVAFSLSPRQPLETYRRFFVNCTMEKIVKILSIRNVTHNVRSYQIEKPDGYTFEPGQATELSINKDKWKEEKRPFTFTSLNEWTY